MKQISSERREGGAGGESPHISRVVTQRLYGLTLEGIFCVFYEFKGKKKKKEKFT